MFVILSLHLTLFSICLINNSLIGVVSKDGSFVKIQNSKATKIKKFCVAAYNKKPEFEGATLIKSNFICELSNEIEGQTKEFQDLKSNIK